MLIDVPTLAKQIKHCILFVHRAHRSLGVGSESHLLEGAFPYVALSYFAFFRDCHQSELDKRTSAAHCIKDHRHSVTRTVTFILFAESFEYCWHIGGTHLAELGFHFRGVLRSATCG